MEYKNSNVDFVRSKILLTSCEAGKLVGIGRDQMREMALADIAERGRESFALFVGKNRVYIKKAQFMKEVAGIV